MSGLLICPMHREKMSSMYRFQTILLKTVLLKLCVSIYAMKMLGKQIAVFVLIAVP